MSKVPLPMNRREMAIASVSVAAMTVSGCASASHDRSNIPMIACVIRYQIDPLQLDGFRQYAENWGHIIPRCGGHLIGYFLPHEGTNDIAWGLIGFESLAAYERYRGRLKTDPQAQENFRLAQSRRMILREERSFVAAVEGTSNLPSQLREPA